MKKRILTVIALLILAAAASVVLATAGAAEVPQVEGRPLLVDGAGLLSDVEAAQIETVVKSISAQYGVDVGIMTFDTMDG